MKQWLIDDFNDFLTTLGLLALWLAEMACHRRYKPLDVFLYDQGYIPLGGGIWIKRDDYPDMEQGQMSKEPTKPLVVKCRVTLPKGVDLLSFYRRFTEGKFTVLRKGNLVPKRDGTGDNFYMDLFIWDDPGPSTAGPDQKID